MFCQSICCLLIHSNGRPSSVERPTYIDRPRCCPRRNRAHSLNCDEEKHSLKQRRRPSINASGCLNPDLGQLGDDIESHRRWQARIMPYRRQVKPSHSNNNKKYETNRRRLGHSCRQRHSHGEQMIATATTLTEQGNQWVWSLQYHSRVPRSPASSAVAPASGIRYDASYNPAGNPNARHPGTFRTGNCQADDSTATLTRPLPALQGQKP